MNPNPNESVPEKLDRYLSGRDLRSRVSDQLTRIDNAQILDADDVQHAVGQDVVILYRGLALVPFLNGARVGYDVMPCYDLDGGKPVVRLAESDDSPGPDAASDHLPGEFPRVADPGQVLDPRD